MRVGHLLYISATITFHTEPLILHDLDTSIISEEGSLHLCHATFLNTICVFEFQAIENQLGYMKNMGSITKFVSFYFSICCFFLQSLLYF